MLIKVTQDDIDKGIAHQHASCPVARACRRQIDGMFSASVICTGIYDLGTGSKYYLPNNAITFLDKFDAGKRVRPFEFETFELAGHTEDGKPIMLEGLRVIDG